MNKEQHKHRHVELHRMLDELLADYIKHTNKLLSKSSLIELMEWSFKQTTNPDEEKIK